MATAIMLAPLPAVSQENQTSRDRNTSSVTSENRGINSESRGEDRDTSGIKGEGGGDEDLLERLSNSQLKDRLSRAVETVEEGCAEDIVNFCGDVTPGQGRVAMCVQAYEDQLSRQCRSALQRVSSNIEQAVAGMADTCLSGIKSQCGDSQNVGQCLQQKANALQPSCQAFLNTVRQAGRAEAALSGMPVFSADDKNLGQIVDVNRGPDGKIRSVQVQVGRFLGIGDKVVNIDADKFDQLADRIKLRLGGDDVRSLPASKKPAS
jgi:Golgi apparatus protein 1